MSWQYTAYFGLNGPNGDHIENLNILEEILSSKRHLNGYTKHMATGCYQGKAEPSLIVTIIVERDIEGSLSASDLQSVAKEYKRRAAQEEVWITSSEIFLEII